MYKRPLHYMICLSVAGVLLLLGCGRPVSPYEEALQQAGKNRKELEQAVEYYRTQGDSLKAKAAIYLISNMPGKGTYRVGNKDTILNYIASLADPQGWDSDVSVLHRTIDSVLRAARPTIVFVPDLSRFSAEELIRHIDEVFRQWESRYWHEVYSFDEFCEWVLPYRTGTEELEDRRTQACTNKRHGEDSVGRADNPYPLALWLINRTGIWYNVGMARYPFDLSVSEMDKIHLGACVQMSDYAVKILRSRGIPAAMDITPAWSNTSSNHTWNAVIRPNHTSTEIGYDSEGRNDFAYKMVKIFRNTFTIQRNSILYKLKDTEEIPPFFAGFDKKDVTDQYDMPLSDVTIEGLNPKKSGIAYLCTFNNRDWVPVDFAEIVDTRARFRNVGRNVMPPGKNPREFVSVGSGVVLLPTYYIGRRIVPASAPVILSSDGSVRIIRPDFRRLRPLTLTRKYPEMQWFANLRRMMGRSRFEAANKPDFSDAVLLCRIDSCAPLAFRQYPVSLDHPCRYIRFVGSDTTDHDIAEIAFYSDKQKLVAHPIDRPEYNAAGAARVSDGNVLTYSRHYKDTPRPMGFDLGRPYPVTSITCISRTDDNEIAVGDLYELFYWDGRWVSLGRRYAKSPELVYDYAPYGALFLLRDLTRGIEERIFTYENGQQTWW